MSTDTAARPGSMARFRSRQSGHPTGLVGRIFGRAMVKDTADANDRALAVLDLTAPSTVLEVGFGQGRTVAVLLDAFLIRLVLMPVALRLLGRKAWALPRWLDRILPNVRFGHGAD